MSQVALTYSRREWAIELLLLLAQGLLAWIAVDLFFAPFTSQLDPLPVWLPAGLVMLAGALPRLLHDYGVWHGRYGLAMLAAIVLSTLATVKIVAFPGYPWLDSEWLRQAGRSLVFETSAADIAVWAPIGLSLAVWWLVRFNGPPGLERCRATLMAAALVCGLVSIAGYVVTTGPGDRALSLAIVAVFGAILIAIAIARQGHEATHSRRRLLSTVLLPTIAIVVVATLFASVVTFDGLRSSSAALSFLDVVLAPFFQVLVLFLTLLVMIISLPLVWLLSLGDYRGIRQIGGLSGNGPNEPARSMLDWQPPDPVRYLLAFLVLVAMLYGLTRFGLALTRRDLDPAETGEREFGPVRGWGAWLDRFRRSRSVRQDPLVGLRGDPQWAHTVTVRETYGRWLRYAASHQMGRGASETADELDRRAGARLGSHHAAVALDELTAVYDDVRYAVAPATPEQAEWAVRAWRQLQSAETAAPDR